MAPLHFERNPKAAVIPKNSVKWVPDPTQEIVDKGKVTEKKRKEEV